MTKASINYLLALCIFLLSGNALLNGYTTPECSLSFSGKEVMASGFVSRSSVQQDQFSIAKSSSTLPTKKIQIEVQGIEEEENVQTSSKKILKSRRSIGATPSLQALCSLSKRFQSRLAEHFLYSLSNKSYLIFQVFRI